MTRVSNQLNGLLATTIFIQSEFLWENLMGEIINKVLYGVHREIYESVSKMGCPPQIREESLILGNLRVPTF